MFDIGALGGRIELEQKFDGALNAFAKGLETAVNGLDAFEQKLAKAGQDTAQQSQSIGSSITMGIGIAIGEKLVAAAEAGAHAVLGMLDGLLSLGDRMTNTSQAFGVGVEALQKFNVAGAAVGVSGEQIAGGLRKLQVGLAGGNAEVSNAVKFLGLSVQQLKDMKPEDQLQTILEKVDKIPNSMDKTAVATALLGRTGALLAPLGAGLKEAMQRAEDLGIVMSKDTIKAADDLGDSVGLLGMTFDGLKNNFVSVIVESEPLHVLVSGLTDLLGELSVWVKENEKDLRSLVDGGVVFLASSLVQVVNVIEGAAAGFKALADVWTATKTAADLLLASQLALAESAAQLSHGDVLGAIKTWTSYKDMAQNALASASKEVANHQKALDGFVGVADKVKNEFEVLQQKVMAAAGAQHEGAAASDHHTRSLFQSAAAAKEAAKAQKELGDAFTKAATAWEKEIEAATHDKLNFLGGNALDAAADMGILSDQVEKAGGVAELSAGQLDQLVKELTGSMAKGGDNAWGMQTLAQALQQVALNGAKAATVVPVMLKGLGHFGQSFGAQFSDELKNAFTDLPSVILGAVQGGGNVFKAIGTSLGGKLFAKDSALWGAATDFIGQHFGTTVASAIGSAIPGLGALLGPVLGKIGGLIGGLFGGEGKQVNDLRDKFIAGAGGLDVLNKKAHDAGMTLDALLSAKKVTDFQSAVNALNLSFDDQAKTQEFLNATIEKYGFTVDQLGPAFAKQQLTEQAQGLVNEYEALTASGISHVNVIEKMGPAFNDFVNKAIASGQQLPDAMRPMIDELFNSGQLIHENGEAFTQAEKDGLQFGSTLEVSIGKIADSVQKLVNAILGIPTSVPPIDIPLSPRWLEPDSNPPGGHDMPHLATGGIATQPTVGMFGESGPEAIIPLDRLDDMLAHGGGGGPESIIVNNSLAAEKLDSVILRRVRGRYIRVNP